MSLPELARYNGERLPASITQMLERLSRKGIRMEVSAKGNSTGKTINLMWKGKRAGYVNPTVLSRKGVLGYHFSAAGHNHSPSELEGRLDAWFCDRYDCARRDFIIHDGGGTNSGRTYLIIMDPEVAIRVVLAEAGLTED